MGVCYTVIMFDEWNWLEDKENVERSLKESFPVADKLAEWHQYLVFDMDKVYVNLPKHIDKVLSLCEKAWFYSDLAPWLWIEMKPSAELLEERKSYLEKARDRAKELKERFG